MAFVHMGSPSEGDSFFAKYGLSDAAHFSDPDASIYRSFGLRRGTIAEIFNPKVWQRGFEAAILAGHGVGMLAGDGFQMPGVFLIHNDSIVKSFRHETPADRPDYVEMAACELKSNG